MELERILKKLSSELDESRYTHSLNVTEVAVKLASHYGIDGKKAYIAGLLHDCGKSYKGDNAREFIKKIGYEADEIELKQTRLLHGIIGEYLAAHEYGVEDTDILSAIRWHTTGRAGMSDLEKIIYIADYIEPDRSFEGIDEMREEAYRNLDKCMILCADSTIGYILSKGFLLHGKTIETRNFSILRLRDNTGNNRAENRLQDNRKE